MQKVLLLKSILSSKTTSFFRSLLVQMNASFQGAAALQPCRLTLLSLGLRGLSVLKSNSRHISIGTHAEDCRLIPKRTPRTTTTPTTATSWCVASRSFCAAAAAAAKSKGKDDGDKAAATAALIAGSRSQSLVDVPVRPKPRKYFDAKTFRQLLKAFKDKENRDDDKRIKEQYARPPPGSKYIYVC